MAERSPCIGIQMRLPWLRIKGKGEFAPAGTTLIQNTGVWVRNMDVWVHSSMAGLFLFWRDFKEIFPILIFIGVFVIFPVIYVMFRRRRKKEEDPEEE
ncbi:MAG: hypothetical protein JRE10_08095 [Deltaproteobacteria bacterium]|nr:hypothetical protein [Deltaproteobacteria bacterium]